MDFEESQSVVDEIRVASGQAAVAYIDTVDGQFVEHLERFALATLELRRHFESYELPHAQIRGFIVGCVMTVLDG